jgi:hypothetical protein
VFELLLKTESFQKYLWIAYYIRFALVILFVWNLIYRIIIIVFLL